MELGDRVKYWGKNWAFWGGLFGILFAPAFFFIPGIGPILTGGIIGSMLMRTLEGAAVGAALVGGTTALGPGLSTLGVPKDTVIRYEADLKANKFLLIASGAAAMSNGRAGFSPAPPWGRSRFTPPEATRAGRDSSGRVRTATGLGARATVELASGELTPGRAGSQSDAVPGGTHPPPT